MLLLVSFLPFPTKLVGEFIREESAERVAVVFYGFTLLALVVSLTVFMRYAFERRRLVRDHVEEELVKAMFEHRPSYVFYGAAIAVGFVFPTVGVALYLLIALYLGVPARTSNRLVRFRRAARGDA